MAKAVVAILLVGAACGSPKQIADPTPGPPVSLGDAELNLPVLTRDVTSTTAAPTTTTIVEPAPAPSRYLQPVATTALEAVNPSLPYNGWAIPEYIVACETGGTFSWTAYNPSGASGPYQIMPEWFGGELAMNQSHAAQHAMAARIWNGGRGASNWSQCL